MENKYKIILLTVLVLSVFTIAIVELTGISDHSLGWWRDKNHGDAELYDKHNNRFYHGEIYPEQTRTRDQLVHDMPKTTMQFYETKYDFKSVSYGSVLKHSFHFKNTGENPLMIAKTDVNCGCTVSGFPNDPIAPGQEGEVSVEYNTAYNGSKLRGPQEKDVVIHANTMPESVTIKVEANISENGQ